MSELHRGIENLEVAIGTPGYYYEYPAVHMVQRHYGVRNEHYKLPITSRTMRIRRAACGGHVHCFGYIKALIQAVDGGT